MPRPSNRTAIIDAACRAIEKLGAAAITFDAVAAEAGLTKAGVVYHFRSMDVLIGSIHEHLAATWEDDMTAALGKRPEQATDAERVAAYVKVAEQSASRAEVLLMNDAQHDDGYAASWSAVADRWTPPVPSPAADGSYDEEELTLVLAHLAADGLWCYESSTGRELPAEIRSVLVDRILGLMR